MSRFLPRSTRVWARAPIGAPLILAALILAVLTGSAPVDAQVQRPDQLKYPPLPQFSVPKPARFVLDNGMVVMVMEDHELPLVNMTALIRAGSLFDPPQKTGLATIAGDMLRAGGSEAMKPDALDEFLEGRAAAVETGVGADSGSATMSALKADVPAVLKVFADVLRKPAFDADRLKITINEANSSIARQNDNPGGILAREYTKAIYGADSPYARVETYDTIGAITREDLIAWHKAYVQPNRIILGIVGDITVAEARKLVTDAFGDWPKANAPVEPPPQPRPTSPAGVFQIVKDDSTQSFIRVGHQGTLLRTNPDFFAVEIMNEVLSGGFASRLFSSVRTAKGLAYSVSGGAGAGWTRVAPFTMGMSTKVETTAAGIEALLTEVKDLQNTRPPTDAEVTLAKSSILNSFIFNSDSPSEVLGQQLSYEYWGQPLDWLDTYRAGIEKVTTAEVAAAARKYITPGQVAIVVVGPGDGFDKPLSTFGQVTTVDIAIPEPSSGASASPVDASPEAASKGKALIEKAVTAIGGAKALDAVTSFAEKSTFSLQAPQGAMDIKVNVQLVVPDRLRQELSMPMGTISMVLDKGKAFVITPGGAQDLPDSQRAKLAKELLHVPWLILRQRNASGFKATAKGADKVGDTPVEDVVVEYGGEVLTLGIDGTGRVLRLKYRGEPPAGGPPGDVSDVFSDFRDAGQGLTLPFKHAVSFNGQEMMSATRETVTINGPVDEKQFEKPAAAASKPEGRN